MRRPKITPEPKPVKLVTITTYGKTLGFEPYYNVVQANVDSFWLQLIFHDEYERWIKVDRIEGFTETPQKELHGNPDNRTK